MSRRGDTAGLAALVGDDASWVREHAVAGLGRAGAKSQVAIIEQRLVDTGERAHVRAAAARALGALRSSPHALTAVLGEAGAPPALLIEAMYALCRAAEAKDAVRAAKPLVEHSDLLVATHARKVTQQRCEVP